MEPRYLFCEHCGNVVEMVEDRGAPVMCCGQRMTELAPGQSDGAAEKHVPVVEVSADRREITATVGEVGHPMLDAHFIGWVALQTRQGSQRKRLKPGEAPKVSFALCEGDEAEAVYAYCNLHGLWKAEM